MLEIINFNLSVVNLGFLLGGGGAALGAGEQEKGLHQRVEQGDRRKK